MGSTPRPGSQNRQCETKHRDIQHNNNNKLHTSVGDGEGKGTAKDVATLLSHSNCEITSHEYDEKEPRVNNTN
jgi:hypothetical protein